MNINDDSVRHLYPHVRMPKPAAHLFGMPVYESPLCVRKVPVRQHKAPSSKSNLGWRRPFANLNRMTAYHNRIQKKWNKRFGFKNEEFFFIMGGNTVMMAPGMLAKIKIELDKDKTHVY